MTRVARVGLALAAIDLLSALFAISYRTPPRPSAVQTFGVFAYTLSWRCDADVDLHLLTPDGTHVFFGRLDGGGVHLELDDLGTVNTYSGSQHERIVVRQVETGGPYIANVHLYDAHSCPLPVRVRVQLWRLAGRDELLHERSLTLSRTGQEETAFRARLAAGGLASSFSTLPASFLYR